MTKEEYAEFIKKYGTTKPKVLRLVSNLMKAANRLHDLTTAERAEFTIILSISRRVGPDGMAVSERDGMGLGTYHNLLDDAIRIPYRLRDMFSEKEKDAIKKSESDQCATNP